MSNLLEQSRVLVYGRLVKGITIEVDKLEKGIGSSQLLRKLFGDPHAPGNHKPKFAAVYGFEFEAHYYDLAVPTILLVHEDGITPSDAHAIVEPDPKLEGVQVWVYDKADFTMRLDIDSGPLASILLDGALDEAGMHAEMSGRKVSGRKVSGRKVSGRKLSGGSD